MKLLDVNVLIYAFREESQDHLRYRTWLEQLMASGDSFAVAELVLSSFLRIVTNDRIFRPGAPWQVANAFVETIRTQPGYARIAPGPQHWQAFVQLCESSGATADLVADAYHAALAIEHGCEWVTADKHFARFPGLRWRHPLG